MDSAEYLEKTIEAAKALLAREKIIVTNESTEDLTELTRLTRTSNPLTSSVQGFMLKPVDTIKHTEAIRRSKASYYFFSVTFCIWVVLLLVVYIPISGFTTPVFPLILDNNIIMFFLTSAGVASAFSLFIGINKLRGKG